MDMTQSIEPRSDQWNADDLIAGPVTVTISEVIEGKAEHPFDFKLVETPGRAYRPSKTCRRIIVAAWGADTKAYAGRRLTLYREPSIVFAGQRVGGIRVSAMSDIDGPVTVQSQTTRGKRETFVVQPLAALPTTEGGDPPAVLADRPDGAVTPPGMDTNGGSASEAAEPPTVPLWQATEQQMDALTSHQQARLVVLCKRLEIKPTRDSLIGAWGESCRDLVAMIDQVEARVTK